MGDLTIRDEQMIALGERAEAYVKHQAQQQTQNGSSLSQSQYDAASSRSDWEQQFSTQK